jgi:hypothetical protein
MFLGETIYHDYKKMMVIYVMRYMCQFINVHEEFIIEETPLPLRCHGVPNKNIS